MAGAFNKWYDTVENTGVLDPGGLFSQPKDQWLGGSRGALEDIRSRYLAGQTGGQGLIDQGSGYVGQGVDMANQSAADARGYSGQGQGIGLGALSAQDAALLKQRNWGQSMLNTARGIDTSAAQTQLQTGLDQQQRAMAAQAAAARGGNQAAAIAAAQGNAAQMGLATNQQAALLRAQEEQQRTANIMAAQARMQDIYGQQQAAQANRGALGFGMQGQGLGLGLGASNQVIGAGQGQGQLGVAQQGNYLSAEQRANEAQLQASQQNQEAKSRYKGGVLSGFSSAFSMFGGGGK